MRHIRIFIFSILTAGLLAVPVTAQAQGLPTQWEGRVVYVENHARSYPVKRVAENIDNGSSLDLRVVRNCPAGQPCIRIFTVENMPGPQFSTGQYRSQDGYTEKYDIYLERRWERQVSAKKERILVCHEIAFALGLSHRYGANSCTSLNMRGKTKISASERNQLDNWY